jgi:hypothetical protein
MRYALNTVPVNGGATLYGTSTAILIQIGANGYSAKQKHAQSAAALIDLGAAGVSLLAKTAISKAPIVVGATGNGKVARKGETGAANIVIDGRHGIPDPMPRPRPIAAGHPSRVVMVMPDQRVVIVPAPSRDVLVRPDNRTIYCTELDNV